MVDHKLDDVFGIARDVPLNYVVRTPVDGALVNNLTRDRHLVVYGSSKQGKTSVRKYNLNPDEYVVVTCSNKWDLSGLLSAILRETGFTVTQSQVRTASGTNKIDAKISGKLKTPVAEIGASVGSSDAEAETLETTEIALELDPGDVNDTVRALSEISFEKYIVLEDFHYLPEETQIDFAVALKALHENSSLTIIVVGVWLDENRLVQFNGDLSGRLITINADRWDDESLREVINSGAELLNFQFGGGVVEQIISGSFSSVYVVQETCHRLCEESGLFSTQPSQRQNVGADLDVPEIIRSVVDADSARYTAFLEGFAAGFQATELEMFKYLAAAIVISSIDDLQKGLHYSEIRKRINSLHPKGDALNAGNVTQALKSIGSLQSALRIKPIVLDYDQSKKRIGVVDKAFLIWLQYQQQSDLLATLEVDV